MDKETYQTQFIFSCILAITPVDDQVDQGVSIKSFDRSSSLFENDFPTPTSFPSASFTIIDGDSMLYSETEWVTDFDTEMMRASDKNFVNRVIDDSIDVPTEAIVEINSVPSFALTTEIYAGLGYPITNSILGDIN